MREQHRTEAVLGRISGLRDAGSNADILYAALELRRGIEAKLREPVAPLNSAIKTQRRQYRAFKPRKTLEEAFSSGDTMVVLCVVCEEPYVRVQLNDFPRQLAVAEGAC